MQFLKNIFASFIGTLLAFIAALFLFSAALIGFVTLLIKDTETKTTAITEPHILHLNLNREISELGEDDPLEDLDLPFSFTTGKVGLLPLVDKIKAAKGDANIAAIYLDIAHIPLGYGSLKELRDALIDFKTSGKLVVAYGEFMTERTYYIASVADQIFLNPAGLLEFRGLGGELAFFKGTFEKLGIEAKVFRVGKFKSAVEPFLRKDMSDENREQYRQFLETIYQNNLAEISASRGIPAAELRTLSDNLLVRSPEDAVKYGLVDQLFYYDEVETYFKNELGVEELKFLKQSYYAASTPTNNRKIAVIVAQGDIVGGKGNSDMVYSENFVKDLRKALEDEDVKAIVVRINSPGGSALASDVMWREIRIAAQSKPVIASMSDLAASGGYYMAMACTKIVAQPNTITGSIGVFGLLFNTEQFFNDKVGVTFDRESTGKFTNIGSPNKPMTREDSMIIQKGVNDIYETFTSKAALGRNMTVEEIKAIAQGRVWSGVDALKIGLVDTLGGLPVALEIAASSANLSDYSVDYYPKESTLLEKLSGSTNNAIQTAINEQFNTYDYPFLNELNRIKQMEGVQARLPFHLKLN